MNKSLELKTKKLTPQGEDELQFLQTELEWHKQRVEQLRCYENHENHEDLEHHENQVKFLKRMIDHVYKFSVEAHDELLANIERFVKEVQE